LISRNSCISTEAGGETPPPADVPEAAAGFGEMQAARRA
jgi:hypothetical protein